MNKYKPDNYNSVSSYLMVSDTDRFCTLLKNIFNATPLRRFDRADGSLEHAELKIDDSVIMLSEATDDYPVQPAMLHVYVPDANATYDKALSAGCEGIEAPVQKENDPDVRGMFKDYLGNVWAVGTQTPSVIDEK